MNNKRKMKKKKKSKLAERSIYSYPDTGLGTRDTARNSQSRSMPSWSRHSMRETEITSGSN
jgi:hypothetical protein